MCGRYTLGRSTEELLKRFGIGASSYQIQPRFNIAPGQEVPVILISSGSRQLKMLKWGLVPSWAKEPGKFKPMINARAETLAEKVSFKHAFKRRRCLIPADGFYEWQKKGEKRLPLYVYFKGKPLFAFAGLWETNKNEESSGTCTIVTVAPNNLMSEIHHRMPAILKPSDEAVWLEEAGENMEKAYKVLNPCNDSEMEYHPVSTRVNSYRNDSPDLTDRDRGANS